MNVLFGNKSSIKTLIIAVVAVFICAVPLFSTTVLAQDASQDNVLPTKTPFLEGTINCGDYFTFGNISMDISPQFIDPIAGSTLTFSGKVINPFDYPVVEGQIYAKIFYKNEKSSKLGHLNGYRLVDQFIAVDKITLRANEQKQISFDWEVPEYLPQGDYRIAFYYSSAGRYNLTGLTFTNDVTGSAVEFFIKNQSAEPVVYLDEDTVLLNDEHFYFAQQNPTFKKDENITAYVEVVNPKDKATSVEVSWSVYSWDSLLGSNLKTQKKETIKLNKGERKQLSYDVPIIGNAVTYVVVESKDHDAKSILNLRFTRVGVEDPRSDRLGMLTYPILKNTTNTLFVCAHSAGLVSLQDSSVTVTLRDNDKNVIHSYTYSNDLIHNIIGLKDDFVLDKDLYDFTLTSSITLGGKLFEETTVSYSCSDIDPNLCPSPETEYNNLIILISVIIAICVLILLVTIARKKFTNTDSITSYEK